MPPTRAAPTPPTAPGPGAEIAAGRRSTQIVDRIVTASKLCRHEGSGGAVVQFRVPEHSVPDPRRLGLLAAALAAFAAGDPGRGRAVPLPRLLRPSGHPLLRQPSSGPHVFDRAMQMFQGFHAFKGVAAFTIVYAAFARNPGFRTRLRLLAGCAAASVAAGVSRAMQIFLPSSARPKFDANLDWSPPYGGSEALRDWSSSRATTPLCCSAWPGCRRPRRPPAGRADGGNRGAGELRAGLHGLTIRRTSSSAALLGCAFVLAAAAVADRIAIPDAFIQWVRLAWPARGRAASSARCRRRCCSRSRGPSSRRPRGR